MNKNIFAGLIVLVLATLACGLPSINTGGTNTPAVPPVDNNLLFQDDFSDTGSGWDRYEDTDMYTDYDNGVYRIKVYVPNYWSWANPGQSFSSDVSISVNATMSGGPVDNAFGVICRYKDVENYYIIIISSDGYAGIARRFEGSDIQLISGDAMITSDAINQGAGATNKVQADCIGNTITLTVNGTKILTATDASITSGDVGLVASSFSEGGVDITFDDFVVTKP
jgi:hypothetical protein